MIQLDTDHAETLLENVLETGELPTDTADLALLTTVAKAHQDDEIIVIDWDTPCSYYSPLGFDGYADDDEQEHYEIIKDEVDDGGRADNLAAFILGETDILSSDYGDYHAAQIRVELN